MKQREVIKIQENGDSKNIWVLQEKQPLNQKSEVEKKQGKQKNCYRKMKMISEKLAIYKRKIV